MKNRAEHSDDGTGPGVQQLAPSNFIEIDISCRLWARAAPDNVSHELWMQQVTARHHTSPLLPRKTITTDGA